MIEKVRKRTSSPRTYSDEFKQKVLRAIIDDGLMPTEIVRRFGVKNESTVRNWINKYNQNLLSLPEKQDNISDMQELSKEDLEKKVKDLEKQLSYEKMKSEALDIMIKIAEKELKISIRKKSDTKQFKQ
jgi:transposase-like protein